jgi:hypothetical protein
MRAINKAVGGVNETTHNNVFAACIDNARLARVSTDVYARASTGRGVGAKRLHCEGRE